MKPIVLVIALVAAALAAPLAAAQEPGDPYLVPIAPSELLDSRGFRWAIAIWGFNDSSQEVPLQCSMSQCPKGVRGSFFLSGPRATVERPSLLFVPRDRQADVVLGEQITAMTPEGVVYQSHRIQVPVVRLADIGSTKLTFVNVNATNVHDRVTFRLYSPLGDQSRGSVTLRVYARADETGVNVPEFPIYQASYELSTLAANGVSLGYAKIFWPSELENDQARIFPLRVEFESATPIWGFATTTENLTDQAFGSFVAPAVTVQLPVALQQR